MAMVILIAWPWNHALSVVEAAKDQAPGSPRVVLGNRDRAFRRVVQPGSSPQSEFQAHSQIDAAEEDDDGSADFAASAIAALQSDDLPTAGPACSASPIVALRPLSLRTRYWPRC
jgi:hypothetical protein